MKSFPLVAIPTPGAAKGNAVPARFLYARFPTAEQGAALDWLRAVDEFTAGFAGSTSARPLANEMPLKGPVLAWRLVSDNRREIARGCRLYAIERDAQADIAQLLRGSRELVLHAAPGQRARTTGWFATYEGLPVMRGARRYENRSTSLSAGALAIRLVRELADAEASGDGAIDGATAEFAV